MPTRGANPGFVRSALNAHFRLDMKLHVDGKCVYKEESQSRDLIHFLNFEWFCSVTLNSGSSACIWHLLWALQFCSNSKVS